MSDHDTLEELWRRLRALESVRLTSENIPPLGVGFIPEPGTGWNVTMIQKPEAGGSSNWYLTDLAVDMLGERDVSEFDEGIRQIASIQQGEVRQAKASRWRTVASLTLFFPLVAILAILRFPTYRGSMYTVGQALLGFTSYLAVVGALVGLLQQNWLLVGISVYWWVGAKVIETEARARGLPV